VELGIELLEHFLDEAQFAELGEDCAQEVTLVLRQVVLCELEQHGLRLTKVSTSNLA